MRTRRNAALEGRDVSRRADAGLGIAETLVALVIFSTAILGIAGTAARVGALMNSAHARLAASALARQQVELLLSEPYDSVAAGNAERDGVSIRWTVAESSRKKEILLIYSYELPGRVEEDSLNAALVRR